MTEIIHRFSQQQTPSTRDPAILGSKGAGLVEMAAAGVNVPPGFILGTDIGRVIAAGSDDLPEGLMDEIARAVGKLDTGNGARFNDRKNPLLVSVRSGAAVSMPGMMDTVLNLGLTRETVPAFISRMGDERFGWDTYRRFIQSYAQVVLGLDNTDFEIVLEEARSDFDVATDGALPAEALIEVAAAFEELVEEQHGSPLPQDPMTHLHDAVMAVFRSWNSTRAKTYRQLNNIDDEGGTAATVQAMVFGNRDQQSGTGVYFTRNPSTADKAPFGEFMINAQGEDVVAGFRTPSELTEAARRLNHSDTPSMQRLLPEAFAELVKIGESLESQFRDMQEVEFTVESGRLWILQSRAGKRSPKAEIALAVDMAEEGLISRPEALARCDSQTLSSMLQTKARAGDDAVRLTKGLPASPGAACGLIVLSADDAVAANREGDAVILVRSETDPKDIHGMDAAVGILTSRGGMTSHAAVVARGMGKPCITAATGMKIDPAVGIVSFLGQEFTAGTAITIDGATGEVWQGTLPVETPQAEGKLARLLQWRDEG